MWGQRPWKCRLEMAPSMMTIASIGPGEAAAVQWY